jgi:hypothetical protein
MDSSRIRFRPRRSRSLQGARIARRDNRLPAAAQCDRGLCRHRRAAPEFNRLAPTSRRACLIYIRLIEQTFDDLPLAALADRRVPGEFKTWRSRLGDQDLARLVCSDAAQGRLRLHRRRRVTGLTFRDLRRSAVVRLALAEATVPQIATFTGAQPQGRRGDPRCPPRWPRHSDR